MNMHSTTNGKPLDFQNFQSVCGVLYPANMVVVPPILRSKHVRVTAPSDEPEIQRLVNAWAAKTGKDGARHSQSRQGIRRKIRKNGLDSAYAKSIRREAGL